MLLNVRGGRLMAGNLRCLSVYRKTLPMKNKISNAIELLALYLSKWTNRSAIAILISSKRFFGSPFGEVMQCLGFVNLMFLGKKEGFFVISGYLLHI